MFSFLQSNRIGNIGIMRTMKAPAPNSEFVRPAAVARRYDVTPRTVLNWIAAGVFPAVKRGKVTRIRMADAVAALEGKERTP